MTGGDFARRFVRKPLGLVSATWLAVVVLVTVAAPLLAPHSADAQDLAHVLSGPTSGHLLGTGVLGRDELSRLLYGGQSTLLGVLVACLIYLAVGVPLGLVGGYFGGLVDSAVLRLADLVYAVPAIIVLLVVVSIFPGNETAAMVALGVLGGPGLARVVRSITREERKELYVRAAQVAGLHPVTIMRRHILPRLAGTVIVQLSLFGAAAVLLETGLGFLGLAGQQASWGGLVAEASQNLGTQPWLLVPSGGIVISFILALGLTGDAVRDVIAERRGVQTHRAGLRRARPTPAQRVAAERTRVDGDSALLSVEGLTSTFGSDEDPVTVISDVHLTITRGQALGVLGESGCGKSVTARSILGLLGNDGRVSDGHVYFEGHDLVDADHPSLRRVRGGRIGWIAQDPIAALDPSFTVGSQVAEAVRAHRDCSRRAARARAVQLLASVRLPDPEQVARRYPHQLSGGMAQRVGIAAALACDPALLIADEPTTALDVTVQAEILDLLHDLQVGGMAVILVTHDWGVVADLCDSAVVMYAGQVVERGPLADLIRAPKHPYTAALLAADPHRGTPGTELATITGQVPPPGSWPGGCRFADRCALAQPDCSTAPIPMLSLVDRDTRCIHHDLVGAPAAAQTPQSRRQAS